MLTGHGDRSLGVEVLEAGAYTFVPKPIDREYFTAWLKWHSMSGDSAVRWKRRGAFWRHPDDGIRRLHDRRRVAFLESHVARRERLLA